MTSANWPVRKLASTTSATNLGNFSRDVGVSGEEREKQMQTSNYVSRKAASAYLQATWGLRRSPNYLAKLAVIGGGPPFHKAGRDPLYAPGDLDSWATTIIGPRLQSTSEARNAAQAAGCNANPK